MSVRNQLKLLMGGLSARRSGRAKSETSAMAEFLDRSRVVAALIFVVTVATIVLVSSAGVSTFNVPVQPNQIAPARVTAVASFSYISEEKTRTAREQFLNRVPPVYRLDIDPLRRFEAAATKLINQLLTFEGPRPPKAPLADRRAELAAIADTFNSHGPYHATIEDIEGLLSIPDAKTRAIIFDNGLATLRDLYAEGIADSSLASLSPGTALLFQIARPNGTIAQRPVKSLEDALTLLRVSLATDQIPRHAAQAIFRIFRFGVTPNVVFDREATQSRQATVTNAIKPVVANVVRGQTIIEQGDRVTPEQYELFLAHRAHIREHGDTDLQEGLTLFGRVLLVLAMVLASLIYIRIEDPETLRSNVRCGLLALVVIANLALVRAIYELGGTDFFVHESSSWASVLPYIAPTAFAPLIVAILIDAGSGIFMALLISIFTGVIYGKNLDLLVLTFLSSLVAIYFSRDARRRSRLVRAAGMGGLTVAAFASLIAIADQTTLETLLRQVGAGLGAGLVTGVLVVGLLPVLESLFKRTTDITLLELTDYNHPLLRHMQLEAPGTYHHSLVVAQLSENAANAIGANPLIARVAALFHDVGKTLNPQFFGENQRDRIDPHAHLSPAESARIIKQHVSDGVDLAHKHHLPRAIIDVIQQHHGTTLVRYFYQRAVEQSRAPFPAKDPKVERAQIAAMATPVSQEGFRYDGPKPQFKESAIISLADGVEAAGRSLREVAPEQLHQLINRIVDDRIAEGQLDEAPVTLEELTRVKQSFQFTLLNMLHGRVAYPPVDDSKKAEAKA